MATRISAETLPPISHKNTPVITTDLLATLYGTDTNNIKVNYTRNADRFICGKHYFKLEGATLREFKDKVTQSNLVASRAKHLILWTERGAARHAKMLETDQAWEVFEKLEDNYFNQVSPHPTSAPLKNFPADYKYYAEVKNGVTTHLQIARENEAFISPESFRELMERAGWLMIHCDELKNMTIDKFMKLGATSQKTLELWKRK